MYQLHSECSEKPGIKTNKAITKTDKVIADEKLHTVTLTGISMKPRKSSTVPFSPPVDFLADCITSLKNLLNKNQKQCVNHLLTNVSRIFTKLYAIHSPCVNWKTVNIFLPKFGIITEKTEERGIICKNPSHFLHSELSFDG